ncbi:MAG: GMC family oxidoreductase N-terminal domain-containing protein [Deltaproteobacteria bacterium]|nr:GMC family oxidoreductase N-terminal domain-containing protein [Deltaproteobacteria bacterium]
MVVVGAGAAGSVIAARVTEANAREVLLLEAGPDYPDPAELPRDLADGRRNSMRRHDWRFRHRPRPELPPIPFPRGRVVGGSSAVNTCIAVRGEVEDFEEWRARGLAEWSWPECLVAFKRLERDLDFNDAWHGNEGPLPIRRHAPSELAPWQAGFLEACAELGLPRSPDHNRPGATGAAPHAMNLIHGRRISAAEAYLTGAVRDRPNLRVEAEVLVRRILFDGTRVRGVEVERGDDVAVIATKQVVLSAGAIQTPGILLRSGVGPRRELERLGVEKVALNEAVGARLLDHFGTALFFRPRRGVIDRGAALIQVALRTRSQRSAIPNDLQLQPGSIVPLPWFELPLVSIMCPLGKPHGTSTLSWPTADPHEQPLIRSAYFEDPRDLALALEAMAMARALGETRALRGLASLVLPSSRTVRDPAAHARWIRRLCDSGYHPCGTVPMGAEEDPSAATDGRGRLRGVSGLIVADASLMPTIPTSNIHLATLMIGERFGEWLRGAG